MNKKAIYTKPEINFEQLCSEDVITASTPTEPTTIDSEKDNRYVSIFDMDDI